MIDGFYCICHAGYEGAFCEFEVNECDSQPCRNGATCHNLINAYRCLCPRGYAGLNCEVKELNHLCSADWSVKLNSMWLCLDYLDYFYVNCNISVWALLIHPPPLVSYYLSVHLPFSVYLCMYVCMQVYENTCKHTCVHTIIYVHKCFIRWSSS